MKGASSLLSDVPSWAILQWASLALRCVIRRKNLDDILFSASVLLPVWIFFVLMKASSLLLSAMSNWAVLQFASPARGRVLRR